MHSKKVFGLGLIGCGTFGRFCLRAYKDLPDVRLVAAAEHHREGAQRCRSEFGVDVYHHSYELIARDDVDIVHIATPPATHHDLVMQCVVAHKNVLCEKPLCMTSQQGREMLQASRAIGTIVPVNFIMRHNAVVRRTKEVIESGLLGHVLHGKLTNCATDSHLDAGHWFWRKEVSGGIFIEHSVHFFDLYRYWLGQGQVTWAMAAKRPHTEQEDRCLCTVLYEGGAIVQQYHGFDQVASMDRTDHRLVCELGDIMVEGWVPLRLVVETVVDDQGLERLRALFHDGKIEIVRKLEPDERQLPGRGKVRAVTVRARATYQPNADKSQVYSQSIRDLLADQLAFLHNQKHQREVLEEHGLAAVTLAERASELAAEQQHT